MSQMNSSFTLSGGKLASLTPGATAAKTPTSRASELRSRLSAAFTPKVPTPGPSAGDENVANGASLTTPAADPFKPSSTLPRSGERTADRRESGVSKARRLSEILRTHATPTQGTPAAPAAPAAAAAPTTAPPLAAAAASQPRSGRKSLSIPSLAAGFSVPEPAPRAPAPAQSPAPSPLGAFASPRAFSQDSGAGLTQDSEATVQYTSAPPSASKLARSSSSGLRDIAKSAEKKARQSPGRARATTPKQHRKSGDGTTELLLSNSGRKPARASLTGATAPTLEPSPPPPAAVAAPRLPADESKGLSFSPFDSRAGRGLQRPISPALAMQASARDSLASEGTAPTVDGAADAPAARPAARAAMPPPAPRSGFNLDASVDYKPSARRMTVSAMVEGEAERQQTNGERTTSSLVRRHTLTNENASDNHWTPQRAAKTKAAAPPSAASTAAVAPPAPPAPPAAPPADEAFFDGGDGGMSEISFEAPPLPYSEEKPVKKAKALKDDKRKSRKSVGGRKSE
ncbi:hypothetical protein TeGR_g1192, partial [Tetraparma gracilis]